MKAVLQEQAMGCAVACVAATTGKTYREARHLFELPDRDRLDGFTCADIVLALHRAGHAYRIRMYTPDLAPVLQIPGAIVFVEAPKRYGSFGHFILRTTNGWMNPWINTPCIAPAQAGIERDLIGEPKWVIIPELTLTALGSKE